MSLFNELKRRNVFKVTIAYIILAWLLMQVADVILNNITAPGWIFHVLLLFLAIGLPFAVFFAWAFELTPEGLKRDSEVDHSQSITPQTGKKLNLLTIAVLILALGYFAYDKFVLDASRDAALVESTTRAAAEQGEPTESRKSIAVLPFTNRSNRQEDQFFTDGIHDDLLTMLARINSFSVISRTTVMRYQDSKMSIPEISGELGVNYVLEGSVQRDGDHIRVNAQLIDAGRDDHLWAETFDRELSTASLFAIQSNIARAIASALNARLSNADETLLDSIPTDSMAAYDAYLMGRQGLLGNSTEAYQTALTHFEDALSQDAKFAGAYAGICEAQLGLYTKSSDIAHFQAAESACKQALTLDADRTEVHIALGSLFRHHGDYQQAEEEQRKVLAVEPQNIYAMIELGLTLAEQGKIRETETILLKAEKLQPDHWPVQDALYSFYRQNDDQADRYERAVKHGMRVVELNPKSSAAWNNLGTAYHSLQQYDAAKSAWDSALQLEPTRAAYTNRGLQYYYEGHYADSAEMQLKAIELAPNDHRAWGRLAESYRAMGENEDAEKEAYEKAIPLAESMLAINDQDWRTSGMLASYYVHSGQEENARRQIENALSVSKRNPEALLYAALVFNELGDEAATLSSLEEMVEGDNSYRHYAAQEPDLSLLLGNERFDRLIKP